MTDHPLTDEMVLGLLKHVSETTDWNNCDKYPSTLYARAAADWQLKQVKERVAAKIAELRQRPGWNEDAWTLEFYFESILKDLRPQEDN